MSVHFGIDFGTTNSAAVKLVGVDFQKYGDEAGRPLPSVVALDCATGEAICGREVWQKREEYRRSGNYHVIDSIKRYLGTDERWVTEARIWTPEDVASVVLKRLSERAANLGVDSISQAVVTIPVDHPPEARRALRRAAANAGIEVTTFVTESTAALVRHFASLQHCRYVAVFDWGGGTLDISVLEIRDARVLELATEGMDIAGDVIDDDFAQAVHAIAMEHRKETSPFSSMSSVDRDNLRAKCELAKRQFSRQPRTDILLSAYGGRPLSVPVERTWFESLIATHVDLAIEALVKAVQRAGLSFDALNRLLVIGGSSQLRLLHEKLRNDARFAAAFHLSSDAEWDVAAGAALVARSPGSYEIAENIGILLSDNSFYELIREGDRTSPGAKTVSLALVEDAKQANIIVAKQVNGRRRFMPPEHILQFGVDTNGFDLECIDLSYRIDPDLILELKAHSRARANREIMREYGKLRFTYHIESV
jgi:molecular chaperone DnaK